MAQPERVRAACCFGAQDGAKRIMIPYRSPTPVKSLSRLEASE